MAKTLRLDGDESRSSEVDITEEMNEENPANVNRDRAGMPVAAQGLVANIGDPAAHVPDLELVHDFGHAVEHNESVCGFGQLANCCAESASPPASAGVGV
jgi:hypothetical protein